MRRLLFSLILVSSPVIGATRFCDDAPMLPLADIIAGPGHYTAGRVRTEGLFRTDAKEWSLLTPSEDSRAAIGLESDDDSARYRQSHGLPVIHRSDLLDDFFGKLRAEHGHADKPDMARIADYRQKRLVCGRIIQGNGYYVFAVDDFVVEDSYLIEPR